MTRFGVLTTSYPRTPGDPAGHFVGGLARWLAAHGHDVSVVAAAPGDDRDGAVRVARVRTGAQLFYDEGAPDRLERRFAPASAAGFSAALLARAALAARRESWQEVISHWLLPCGAAGALLGLPHLAIAHSGDVHLAVRLGLADPLAALLLRSRTRVAFVAEHLRAKLLQAVRPTRRTPLQTRSFICPMGVDPPRPWPRMAAQARFGLDPDRPVIGFLGRHVPIKGIPVLLGAARPGWQLLIAGDGPLREELQARAPWAIFPGELRGADKDAFFGAIDVLTLPSIDTATRTEGAPTVALEAFAAGVPLVASDLPGVRELAGEATSFFTPGDPARLAASIERVLADPVAWTAKGRELAARFSWDSVGARLFTDRSVVPMMSSE